MKLSQKDIDDVELVFLMLKQPASILLQEMLFVNLVQ